MIYNASDLTNSTRVVLFYSLAAFPKKYGMSVDRTGMHVGLMACRDHPRLESNYLIYDLCIMITDGTRSRFASSIEFELSSPGC